MRDDFATPWVAWNIVRTLALTAAFGCLAWALVPAAAAGMAMTGGQPASTGSKTCSAPPGEMRIRPSIGPSPQFQAV